MAMTHGTVIRAVRDHEWREVRELRLRALRDEVAAIAFVDTVEQATARPDEFWQERTARASAEAGRAAGARQFVAIADDGTWIGSTTVLLERVGEKDFDGVEILRSAGALVGVYLDPAHRGRGILPDLFGAAVDWVRERGLDRVRLLVHRDNARAQKAYARAGFAPTGVSIIGSVGPEIEMARDL